MTISHHGPLPLRRPSAWQFLYPAYPCTGSYSFLHLLFSEMLFYRHRYRAKLGGFHPIIMLKPFITLDAL
jgi:hypothetical protein